MGQDVTAVPKEKALHTFTVYNTNLLNTYSDFMQVKKQVTTNHSNNMVTSSSTLQTHQLNIYTNSSQRCYEIGLPLAHLVDYGSLHPSYRLLV